MDRPLVSVICLCYNQATYVEEALRSVFNQTYPHIEVIIVDDASQDESVTVIRKVIRDLPNVQFLSLTENVGNCKAFNRGLTLAKGAFVIDFATDDVMTPERIERQVTFFASLDESYGVVFTDATYIDEAGRTLRGHYDYLLKKKLIRSVPSGDVYRILLTTYFISSPTMMIRKKVLDELNGYDEALAYEDFDFWVRSSRNYHYGYLPENLTNVRKTARSMSTGWYKPGDKQLHSTYLVCRKAQRLNRSKEEDRALASRAQYELRQAAFSENHPEAELFYRLIRDLGYARFSDRFFYTLQALRLPLSFLRNWYQRLRFS